MTPKRKRLWLLLASLCVLGAAATLVLTALNDNIVFFYSPTQVAEKKPGPDRRFRLGGLVEAGSVQKSGQEVRFTVTDMNRTVKVVYRGLLPDLFTHLNPMPWEAACQMEKDLADELQEKGWAVWQA